MTFIKKALCGLVVALGIVAQVNATPITFSFWGTATGSLGGQSFTDAAFSVTSLADTNNVHHNYIPGVDYVYANHSSISIAGFGLADFTIAITDLVNRNIGAFLFSDPTQNRLIMSVANSDALTYDLTSSIGPDSGPSNVNTTVFFGTSLGLLNLTNISENNYQAVLGETTDVPEPGILMLILIGLGMMTFFVRRRTL
ncbi:MAG TPA: PEP-CTERM sorting domain-containing protein [Burkholderiaceae bacterium]|jgi:hypothetical protein